MPKDCIRINHIRAYGYVGYFPAEKQLGQWFEVDLALYLDLTAPGTSDRLADTLNYATVVATVRQLVQTARCDLVERLATQVIQAIFQLDRRLQTIDIRLVKLAAPIPDFAGDIAIELSRDRP